MLKPTRYASPVCKKVNFGNSKNILRLNANSSLSHPLESLNAERSIYIKKNIVNAHSMLPSMPSKIRYGSNKRNQKFTKEFQGMYINNSLPRQKVVVKKDKVRK